MIQIKKNTIFLELTRNDLWHIATALRNEIINESRIRWIRYFKGCSEQEFITYVRSNHFPAFKYLEEIYIFLNREDKLVALEIELINIHSTYFKKYE
ncbi:hypothetical protein PODO_06895 [Paenibacillus odorifer]|nr:hypothetical protein PODO_06895 [Paenibacillus odorifer]